MPVQTQNGGRSTPRFTPARRDQPRLFSFQELLRRIGGRRREATPRFRRAPREGGGERARLEELRRTQLQEQRRQTRIEREQLATTARRVPAFAGRFAAQRGGVRLPERRLAAQQPETPPIEQLLEQARPSIIQRLAPGRLEPIQFVGVPGGMSPAQRERTQERLLGMQEERAALRARVPRAAPIEEEPLRVGPLARVQNAIAGRYTYSALQYGVRPDIITTGVAMNLPWRNQGYANVGDFMSDLGYLEVSPGRWVAMDPIKVTGLGEGTYSSGRTTRPRRTIRGTGRDGGARFSSGFGMVHWRIN